MTKLIVLDKTVESMTTFKQIIGRGTRIREKDGKTHFVVMDFRNVTRLFTDPDWDGPVEQDEGFQHGGSKPKGSGHGGGGKNPPDDPVETPIVDKDGCKVKIINKTVSVYDANGKPEINPESGYTETGFWSGELYDGKTMKPVENISNMYKDRDPRFYASISFQGTYWKSEFVNRPLYYAYWLNNSDDNFEGNKKLVGKSNETGYGIRKWMDPNINLKMSWRTSHHYPLFRLAEQYLNCAEAWNEYLDRPDDKVYSAINAVRNRVGMPSLPITEEDKTQAGMRKRIRNERRVELFYENHRFYDVRRWMIAKKVDGSNVTGMNSLPAMDELEKAAQASGLNLSVPSESKQVGLSVFYKRSKLMKRVFEDKHYLFPIPQTEIDKNKNLVQNHGW